MTSPKVRPSFPNQVRRAVDLFESVGDRAKLYELVHRDNMTGCTWIDGPFWIIKMTKDRIFVQNLNSTSDFYFYPDAGLEAYDSGVWNSASFIRPYNDQSWVDDWF